MGKLNQRIVRMGLALCIVSGLLTACASRLPKSSGFLAEYGSLEPDPGAEGVFLYRIPEKRVEELTAHYTGFIIDPVVVYFHPDAIGRAVKPDDLKVLADFLRQQLIAALKDGYPVVETPGPDVVRIRVAVTNVLPRKPRLTYHPAETAFNFGEAAIEAEFLDSKTGERLVAVMDTRLHESNLDLQNQSMKEHAQGVVKSWSRLIRDKLDNAYGIGKPAE